MTPPHPHDTEPPPHGGSGHPTRTALVLGGGGSAGNAWLIGVIAGLADAGLDVTDADLVIGTSAGSTAAAQLTGAPAADLYADVLATAPARRPGPRAADAGRAATRPVMNPLVTTNAIIAAAADAADMRRSIGAWALENEAAAPRSEQWRATVSARLPSALWPRRRLLITAVDAESGDPFVLDRDSGVDLVDAVAASCSSASAYRIGSRYCIDGGYRSNADNADLAAGYERVLVLSPFGGRSRTPFAWGLHLATQVDDLRAGGSQVETIFPDASSLDAFGDNVMSPATRQPAARAGHDQGGSVAEQLTDFWR